MDIVHMRKKMPNRFNNTLSDEEHDKLFCSSGKKYGLKASLLKAIAQTESNFEERAYRFEPKYWERYMKGKPEWNSRDPKEVSASFGLFQIMYGTAHMLGFRGKGEDLYNPVYNTELACKLLRQLYDKVIKLDMELRYPRLSPIVIVLARYNGGATNNPSKGGKIRNQIYVDKVLKHWRKIIKEEKICPD